MSHIAAASRFHTSRTYSPDRQYLERLMILIARAYARMPYGTGKKWYLRFCRAFHDRLSLMEDRKA